METTKGRVAVHNFTAGDFRMTIFNDNSFRKDRILQGKIVSINKTEKAKQTNSNGNVFWIATVEAEINGKKTTGPAIIWDAQLTTTKLPADTFAPGAPISIAVQVNGEYAGNAQVQLPGGTKFDLSEIVKGLDVADAEFARLMAEAGLEPIKLNA